MRVLRFNGKTGEFESAVVAPIESATSPETTPEQPTWGAWLQTMAEIKIDGWTPCRFGVRFHDQAIFVFGIVRGDYGVWNHHVEVCHHPLNATGERAINADTALIAALTHLPTGLGLGLYHDRQTACEAANHISNIVTVVPESGADWLALKEKIETTLKFNGIRESMDWHAHPQQGSPPYGIWTKSDAALAAGKPERMM